MNFFTLFIGHHEGLSASVLGAVLMFLIEEAGGADIAGSQSLFQILFSRQAQQQLALSRPEGVFLVAQLTCLILFFPCRCRGLLLAVGSVGPPRLLVPAVVSSSRPRSSR